MLVLRQLQTFCAAPRHIQLYLCSGKQLTHHHQVHVVIVHDKDTGIRGFKALLILLTLVQLCAGGKRKHPQLLIIHNILFQHDDKRRTFCIHAVDADFAAHQMHKLLHNAQAQPCTLDVAVALLVHTLKRVKDIWYVFLFHA